jgi:hypothetical protein
VKRNSVSAGRRCVPVRVPASASRNKGGGIGGHFSRRCWPGATYGDLSSPMRNHPDAAWPRSFDRLAQDPTRKGLIHRRIHVCLDLGLSQGPVVDPNVVKLAQVGLAKCAVNSQPQAVAPRSDGPGL